MHDIIKASIFAAIGVLVFTSLLVPVVSDAITTEKTYTNEGVFYMTDDPSNYTLEYKGVDQEIWVNGELLTTFADLPNSTWTLISTPEYLIRMQGAGSNYACWLTSIEGTNTYVGSTSTASAQITLSESTITIGSTVVNYSGEFRGIAKTGNYVMTSTGGFVVSDTDTIIIGNGTTGVTHWYDAFYIIGTVENIEVYTNDSITVSNVNVNSTPIKDYNGSTVSSITFTATDGNNTVDAVYNRVIVPVEVTINKTVPASPAVISILSVLPLILICALIMGVLGYAVYQRIE